MMPSCFILEKFVTLILNKLEPSIQPPEGSLEMSKFYTSATWLKYRVDFSVVGQLTEDFHESHLS